MNEAVGKCRAARVREVTNVEVGEGKSLKREESVEIYLSGEVRYNIEFHHFLTLPYKHRHTSCVHARPK